eukprot:4275445-Pyramimonas_sp.AAC.1
MATSAPGGRTFECSRNPATDAAYDRHLDSLGLIGLDLGGALSGVATLSSPASQSKSAKLTLRVILGSAGLLPPSIPWRP